MSIIPYNPNDPTQQGFLAGIRSGESGSAANPYSVGYGGTDLSSASTNSTGFPIWSGAAVGNTETHAAGAYQFQPGTWNPIATQYGLNFQNPQDQDAAAWYNAQQNYPGGGTALVSDLQSGNYSTVGTDLHSQWSSLGSGSSFSPSSGGSGYTSSAGASTSPGTSDASNSATYGQTSTFATDTGTNSGSTTGTNTVTSGTGGLGMDTGSSGSALPSGVSVSNYAAGAAGDAAAASAEFTVSPSAGWGSVIAQLFTDLEKTITGSTTGFLSGLLDEVESGLIRWFLVFIGVVILGIALWKLLSDHANVPAPASTFRSAVKFV